MLGVRRRSNFHNIVVTGGGQQVFPRGSRQIAQVYQGLDVTVSTYNHVILSVDVIHTQDAKFRMYLSQMIERNQFCYSIFA